MSDKIIEVISDKLLYEFYIEDTGELTVGENKLSANADGVSWSLKEPVDKVSINAETGVVTVEYGVADGAEVTVVAKKGEMQFERTFKVKASVREDKTAAISEYWDKSSSDAFALTLDELKGGGVSSSQVRRRRRQTRSHVCRRHGYARRNRRRRAESKGRGRLHVYRRCE